MLSGCPARAQDGETISTRQLTVSLSNAADDGFWAVDGLNVSVVCWAMTDSVVCMGVVFVCVSRSFSVRLLFTPAERFVDWIAARRYW